ncbi:MAG: TIGR00645 family protein [Verrucomicrobia bacterium]|nr:TIGR00645 family protein [Verrucomicrobiota bacterium]
MSKDTKSEGIAQKLEHGLEYFIFASRWVQAPIYVALIFAAIAYAWKSVQELIHLLGGFATATESSIMLGILSLVDISMVANLVNMVVVGGYVTFVSRIDFGDNGDRPDWLDHINANTLKVKLAGSLASISAIHLLKSFIDITSAASADKPMTANHEKVILWQAIIHGVFLLSMILFAWGEKMQRHPSDH